MIKLTANEGKTLEGILHGLNVKQISEIYDFAETTIRGHIRHLLKKQIIRKTSSRRVNSLFALTETPYTIEKSKLMPRIKGSLDPGNDKLLQSAMNKQLSDEQIYFLQLNREKPRTWLAKQMGLTKLQVNFAMERWA